ncbi:hypothetical protein PHYPSEUDO_003504 [Phytophthora pseudosyringae]|uniref:Uncharacterized protein n=1 Tax=Phytophthora pseudosyringae TaxID=221518 RepID=A0A8T1VUC5_9STRA|nr:hypothetical protein PHYPSEUDO_003504 [Phytophthora pseudosyringae]
MTAEEDPAGLEWTEIWRTYEGRAQQDTYLSEDLQRFATVRSELCNCTINHLENDDVDLALTRHSMRSILTVCRSERCQIADSDDVCMCRYKVNTCVTLFQASSRLDTSRTTTANTAQNVSPTGRTTSTLHHISSQLETPGTTTAATQTPVTTRDVPVPHRIGRCRHPDRWAAAATDQ